MPTHGDTFALGTPSAPSAASPALFPELAGFARFLREELRDFPGRGQAVARLVLAVVLTVIIGQTLRVPNPAFSAYLIFFIANEDGISSLRMGLVALAGLTVALAAAIGTTICFMDAPWFRLPATFLLIAGAVWLSRALEPAVLGRMMAVILALYLSLADVIFSPEALTEAVLWLWSGVALSVGVTVLVNFLMEPRPDLLLRAQIVAGLEAVDHLLENLSGNPTDLSADAKSLRRLVYAAPLRMRQLLTRWRQRRWPAPSLDLNWELAIALTERLISISAALAASGDHSQDDHIRTAWRHLHQTLQRLIAAIHERDHTAIRDLTLPSVATLPDCADKVGIIEIASALDDCRLVLLPSTETASEKPEPSAKPGFVPDAFTNPEYAHFTLKTVLAIAACEVFLNAVAWPGIRTSLITCAVTALATVGAQRQKQLLRLTGACVGGLMGLVAVLYLVPHLDSIVGLTLLIAAGTAACAWVAAGSVRSSYAGFQMALAFYIVLLPGFVTSIDLTGIRDRFVGILVGITAMWIFFDHLWHTSSRRQLTDKFAELLQLMARGPSLISPTRSLAQAHADAIAFRHQIYGDLSTARLYLDEARIELTLALTPRSVRGNQLELLAREVSFAAFLLLALNERKLRALSSSTLEALQPKLQEADAELTRTFARLADTVRKYLDSLAQPGERPPAELPALSPESFPALSDPASTGPEFSLLYETLYKCLGRIAEMSGLIRAIA